jgi:hypothetical protein
LCAIYYTSNIAEQVQNPSRQPPIPTLIDGDDLSCAERLPSESKGHTQDQLILPTDKLSTICLSVSTLAQFDIFAYQLVN